MPLSQETIEAVQESYDRCLGSTVDGRDFLEEFYVTLIGKSASIKAMFAKTDMTKQRQLLKNGINMLILYSSGWPSANTAMNKLAVAHDRKHRSVPPELYDFWIQSLKDCVKRYDKDCTPELLAHWDTAISPGIGMMKKAY